jgi:hypothetical protein
MAVLRRRSSPGRTSQQSGQKNRMRSYVVHHRAHPVSDWKTEFTSYDIGGAIVWQ